MIRFIELPLTIILFISIFTIISLIQIPVDACTQITIIYIIYNTNFIS